MIKIDNLVVAYGGIEALKGISLEVPSGKIVTLVGANGAGKSTTLKSIVGLVKPKSGSINYEGTDLTKLKTETMVKEGIAEDLEKVYSLFPRLKERTWQVSGTLSGGEQQMLAIGRALMCRPKLIMMDEPSLGLAPIIVKELFGIIKKINEEGTTVLLIEQNANAALKIADVGYIMETGRITLKGTGKELLNNDEIKKAYLGEQL